MPLLKNRLGIRYGRLIIKEFVGTNWNGYWWGSLWKCICDCGKEIIVLGNSLQSGNTKSCGCYKQETSSKRMSEMASKQTGKNNPVYKDGKHTKAIFELKEKCRKQADYKCQKCGVTQEQNKKKYNEILSIHHIDKNGTNNAEENLMVLCKICHNKTR